MSHQAKSGVVVGIVVLAVGVGFWVSRKPNPEAWSPEAEVAQTDPASPGFKSGERSPAGRNVPVVAGSRVVGSQVVESQKAGVQKSESQKSESPKVDSQKTVLQKQDAGLFSRLKTAVWNFVAPTQKETAKATEEILSKSSQGGLQSADGVAVKTTDEGRAPAGDAEARALAKAAAEDEARARADAEAELKAQKLAESQEAKRIHKLEAQLQRVSLDSPALKVISTLRKKDPQRAPLVEKYVRIALGGEDLEGDGFEGLSEKYVEELNRDAATSATLVFAGLRQAGMDDESQSVRTVLFSLANDLSVAKPEIGRAAWAELQNLAAPGGSQDVKATLAAYIAYSRTLPKGDKSANRALEDYIDDLKDRDPVSAGVLKTRRSPASR